MPELLRGPKRLRDRRKLHNGRVLAGDGFNNVNETLLVEDFFQCRCNGRMLIDSDHKRPAIRI